MSALIRDDLDELAKRWLMYKETEKIAAENRRKLEDIICKAVNFPKNFEGTENVVPVNSLYSIKIEGRINRKVNSDKLIDLATEAGLSDHLSTLFRWKPEINMKVWKESDQEITRPLLDAITSEAGRPSFTISLRDIHAA
jgi:hypothetical protein